MFIKRSLRLRSYQQVVALMLTLTVHLRVRDVDIHRHESDGHWRVAGCLLAACVATEAVYVDRYIGEAPS